MQSNGTERVLAIGLDAAEATLVRRMIDGGELPALRSLLDRGAWNSVSSPGQYSSGAVWPTFYSGRPASDHGLYARWNWDPAQMRPTYTGDDNPTPFWCEFADSGRTVGIIDVPFAPFTDLSDGFEVFEWGPHDRVVGTVRVAPRAAEHVARATPPHPWADDLATPPHAPDELPGFVDECLAGVRLRGDLAVRLLDQIRPDVSVVVFSEVHRAGHYLWHTAEPELDMYADLPPGAIPTSALADVYRETDRQVGRMVEAAGPGTAVMVFALHGMEACRGTPPVLEPFLRDRGMAHLASTVDRRRSALTALKARIPEPIRGLYRRSVPLHRRSRWAETAALPAYDWARTRAFALPLETEAHIRINLAGRESMGIVPPEEYTATCDLLEKDLLALTTVDGRSAVREVLRPPRGTHRAGLPDLVVHWQRAVFESPVLIGGTPIHPVRRNETGRHAAAGFCIATGSLARPGGETILAEELHLLITGASTA